MTSTSTLIDYPCEFPIKIMGKDEREFTKSILIIVNRHIPSFDDKSVETRASKKNKYLSLTCTVYVASQSQLDALYQELCDHPMVLMVL
jgi:putative lipoic acid-binding regulatory protein